MTLLVISGAIMQLYGPLLPILIFYLRKYPQLIMITIASGVFFVLGTIPIAIVWNIPGIKTSFPVVSIFGAIVLEIFRLLNFICILRTEKGFASKQLHLYESAYGITPVAFAAGIGFGTVASLMQIGSLLSFGIMYPEPEYFAPHCNIPYIYQQALTSTFMLYSNICWSIISFHAYVLIWRKNCLWEPFLLVEPTRAIGMVAVVVGLHVIACAATTVPYCAVTISVVAGVFAISCCLAVLVVSKVWHERPAFPDRPPTPEEMREIEPENETQQTEEETSLVPKKKEPEME